MNVHTVWLDKNKNGLPVKLVLGEFFNSQLKEGAKMFEAIILYDFVHDGKHLKGASWSIEKEHAKVQPNFPEAKLKCDLDDIDIIKMNDDIKVKIYWAKDIFGSDGDIMLLKKEPKELALVELCEGQMLLARSEPTVDDRIGLQISNKYNKVLFFGVGDLVQEPYNSQEYHFVVHFRELYSWKSPNPGSCGTVTGGAKKGRSKRSSQNPRTYDR